MGGSQFGGTPHVGPDFDWPLSTGFTVGEAAEDFAHLFRTSPVDLHAPLPLTFIAQIDLAELSPEISGLPDHGRLLFFMDYGGFFIDEARVSTQVIWDRSPVSALTRHDPPEALVWLEDLARQDWHGMTPRVPSLARRMAEFFGSGGKRDTPSTEEERESFNAGFLPPEQSVEMRLTWQRLSRDNVEVDRSRYSKMVRETGAHDVVFSLMSPRYGPKNGTGSKRRFIRLRASLGRSKATRAMTPIGKACSSVHLSAAKISKPFVQ